MKIGIVTPAPPRSRYGNRVTALRWASMLRSFGHRVVIEAGYRGERWDLLVALHARRSSEAVRRFRRRHPGKPVVVALTGTDLYRDLPRSSRARQSLEWATRIVVLQPLALRRLAPRLRPKVRVIYQSAAPPRARAVQWPRLRLGTAGRPRPTGFRRRWFDVCVIGHIRPVKDPFRTALAARRLDAHSRIRVLHVGGAMGPQMAERAREEMRVNPRYRWLGEQPAWRVRRVLARSRLLVLSSKLEGGANVLSEAIAVGVAVLASRVPGSVGILGADYSGYFKTGDTGGLARLLERAERQSAFLEALRARLAVLADRFRPARERAAWQTLLQEIDSTFARAADPARERPESVPNPRQRQR